MAKKRRINQKTTVRKAAKKKSTTPKKPALTSSAKKSSNASQKASAKNPATKKGTRIMSSGRNGGGLEAEIKRIDKEILKLINKRAQLTERLYSKRPDKNSSSYDPHADDSMLNELGQANPGPLPDETVRSIFRDIMSFAKSTVKLTRVAYLGPKYSFTHFAALERFGKSADLIPVSTIASVFEEVNRGHVDFGLVPIENSTDGRIVDTLDMFTRLPLRICGEVLVSIHHNLMSRCPRSEITEIYSKPQALSQCRDWLARNMPDARLVEVTSTSAAAQLARDKPGAAAVASRQAAVEYDLQIVAEKIEDNKHNVTRFAVIGDHLQEPTGSDRTALLLQIPHEPGSLSDALNIFKTNKLNLTWIESFPLRGEEQGYLFFLDFEGHENDPKVRKTLDQLKKGAVRLEILGTYPRSETLN